MEDEKKKVTIKGIFCRDVKKKKTWCGKALEHQG